MWTNPLSRLSMGRKRPAIWTPVALVHREGRSAGSMM